MVSAVSMKNSNVDFDLSTFKIGATIKDIKKNNKAHSLFLTLDKNNDGKIDEKEFKTFKNMDIADFNKIIVISPILEVKKLFNINEITKKFIEEKIEKKEEKIAELIAKKKTLKIKNILLGLGGGAIVGGALKLIFGSNLLLTGCSTIGILSIVLLNLYHNKKIDAEIESLKAEIAILKSAHILIP